MNSAPNDVTTLAADDAKFMAEMERIVCSRRIQGALWWPIEMKCSSSLKQLPLSFGSAASFHIFLAKNLSIRC